MDNIVEAIRQMLQTAFIEYSPSVKERYDAMNEADRQQVDNFIAEKAAELVERLRQEAESHGTTAHKYLNDPETNGKEIMRDWLERAIRDGLTSFFPQSPAPPNTGAAA